MQTPQFFPHLQPPVPTSTITLNSIAAMKYSMGLYFRVAGQVGTRPPIPTPHAAPYLAFLPQTTSSYFLSSSPLGASTTQILSREVESRCPDQAR